MTHICSKLSFVHTLRYPWSRLGPFFRRLQWKLTLSYTMFTTLTVLALGLVALVVLWYTTFWSSGIPTMMADDLLRTGSLLSPYLEHTPPDRTSLNNWLRRVMVGNDLVIKIPGETAKEGDDRSFPPPPLRFGGVLAIAIIDAAGQVVAGYPTESFTLGNSLPISAEAWSSVQAALQGKTDPAELAIRNSAGHIVTTAPIFGSNNQLVGAIFVETVPPFRERDFQQLAVMQIVLPIVFDVLVVGVIAGVLFGYFIARDLTGRLQTLAGAADTWSNGNFEVLVSDDSGDELGQLTQRFNQMALQLQTFLQTRQELATLDERNRLARDLHDAVKQQVFATAMQVGAALAFIDENPTTAKTCLIETDRLVHQTQQELTALIQELRPAALQDKGLTTALREYVDDWSRQNKIAAQVRVRGEQSLSFLVEQTLFRITQEALANIARHSGATSVHVYLVWEGDQVMLTLFDNGQGFNPAALPGKGLGLHSMRERVEAIGGHLSVTSHPEAGTQVTVCCNNSQKA